MSANTPVAVVTGSNKGIGFAIVRGLCKQYKGDVYLTARNEEAGQKAVAQLKTEGLDPKFHQLDITDTDSITRLKTYLHTNYGGLDVLVNNAGMAYKGASTAPFSEQAAVSVKTNFTGTLDVCNSLFPLLRPHARVVNVSSMASKFALRKCSHDLLQKFIEPSITMEQLKKLLQQFVNDTETGNHTQKGWPNTAYGVSKIGVTVMSVIQQRENDHDDIIINCCCPGYVSTDMTSFKGPKTVDQGAETPLYLALLPPNCSSPKGQYLSGKKVEKWQP